MMRQSGFLGAYERLAALSASGDPLEQTTLRDGATLSGWPKARTRQIDRDGRWTLKRGKKPNTAGGRASSGRGNRGSGVRLQQPHRHRPHTWFHSALRRHPRRASRRRPTAGVLDAANTASEVWADTA